MGINDVEWKKESEWLDTVLKEAHKQLDEKRHLNDKIKRENIETQRELWQEVGSVSIANELDQLSDFMSYIDILRWQKRSHGFIEKVKEKYEKMILSPYFGRIDFHESGEAGAEKFYIGISNLVNDDYDVLIYDWRAPVSGMFYDYEIGEASYVCPEGVIKGRLTLKRQYKITNGKIEYMFDSNLKIDDEILQEILSKSTDDKMKAIVTTIQREQNKVIRNEEFKNLIVQGPAGSGKTSIALHRVAYLLYKYREKITSQNIVIFSPNQIFNDYISNVLPQLGEDNISQTTFKEYMHKALGYELNKEDYYDMMEYILSSQDSPAYQRRMNSIKYKSSMEFIHVLKQYVNHVQKAGRSFDDIIFGGKLIISSKELRELFHNDYIDLPIKRRLQKIKNRILYLLEPYERKSINEAAGNKIYSVKAELNEVYQQVDRLTDFNLIDLYMKLFENLEQFYHNVNTEYTKEEIVDIKSYTLENFKYHTLYYEDQTPLLYLKGAFGDLPKTTDIKYVIIDEAQDYTPLQYEVFHQLFDHASITMLGDLNQSINPYMNVGDYNNISHIFSEDNTCIMSLSKSYRSTAEITRFSRKLLNKEVTAESVARHGDEPIVFGFNKEEYIKERIHRDIIKYKGKGYKSIGVITRTKKQAKEVYDYLKDRVEIKVLIDDDEEFLNDVIVIPAYLAKGLEFDVVIIFNAGEGNYNSEEERLLLYTALTRALHVLCVYYSGEPTMLLQGS
ncbi:helicase IV [Oxobacter pfennigii]|uniref:DNA 3'-5' helicase n=1 Tax=Oxobacter pfennigii TaxID=36849 RepID=A0A0P8WBA5_9CLOT|nr:RNA polymerase recycling motor HelD [Oxobacter pfennigii]KPU45205.1 helicase IV [Oxobacter pfennigii]